MRARQEREREFRRECIIEATKQLLKEKTFNSITIDDIAIRSDFAKASIYQYFKNKDELMSEVFSKVLEMQCNLIEEKCLSQSDPVRALRNYLKLELEFICLYPWGPQVRLSIPYKEFHADNHLIDLYNKKKKLVAGILQRGQAEGIFIVADPEVLSNMIITASSGFADHFLSANRSADLQSPVIEIFISTIINGMTRGSSNESNRS